MNPMITTRQAANYLLQKGFDSGEEVTPMKLLKLCYIAHGWYLGIMDKPLFNEQVQAWQYGPVIESVYHDFKMYGKEPITRLKVSALGNGQSVIEMPCDEQTKKFLDKIWEVYGKHDGIYLSSITHEPNTPWDITYNQQGGKNMRHAVIANDLIKSHYKELMSRRQN